MMGGVGKKLSHKLERTHELDTLTVKARVSARIRTVLISYSMVSIEPSLRKGAEKIPQLSVKDAEMFQNLLAALLVGISAMERNL